MNTSIGKRLALLLSGVLLLTGCYAAPAAESVRQGSTPPESAQPTQPPAAETAITTYPVPEENLLVSINMADSPSTGGFWQWDMMLHPYIEAYDPVTRTAYVPCYQSGCRHNDSTCSACFGNLSALAEYRDSLYALVQQDGESAASLVSRPLSGGPLEVLARWEPENENEVRRCGLYGLSFGKAYLTVAKETFAMEDGQEELADEEYSDCYLDLETGELVEYMADEDGYLPYMHGVWGDVAVFQDWYADRPDGTPVKRDGSEDYNFRLYSKNLRTGEEKTIVDVTENFIWTADPHVSWGQYTVYQVDRSVYIYDMETQTSKKLFTHDQDWQNYNYWIMDGHVTVIGGAEDTCRAWAIDIMDGSVVELATHEGISIAFSAHYECGDYFIGLLAGSRDSNNYYISKEDYYHSNFDGVFH